jgi:hypothetical protein
VFNIKFSHKEADLCAALGLTRKECDKAIATAVDEMSSAPALSMGIEKILKSNLNDAQKVISLVVAGIIICEKRLLPQVTRFIPVVVLPLGLDAEQLSQEEKRGDTIQTHM